MDEKLATALAAYGIDTTDAMDRMDDDADLYKKLALKYLNNTNFVDLTAAMEVKDYDTAYNAAHTLKGVAGNLSFTKLYHIASSVCEALRQGESQAAETMMPDLKAAHEKVVEGLEKWQDGEL